MFFLFYFFKNCLCRFYFFNIKLIENLALWFFSLKHCELLQCFPTWFVFMIFSKIISVNFFFNIELIKNYNYNKTKSYRESIVVFLTKHCRLLQYFSKWFFMILSKFVFVDCIGKNTVVSLTKYCQLLQRFSSRVFFLLKISLLIFFNIKLIANFPHKTLILFSL